MTPDKLDYHPCPTCGVLAPVDRPHPATFCGRERPNPPLGQHPESQTYQIGEITIISDPRMQGRPPILMQVSDFEPAKPPVTVDVEALWGGA